MVRGPGGRTLRGVLAAIWRIATRGLLPLALLGCGASQSRATVVRTPARELSVVGTLLDHAAANSRNLTRPSESSESLERQLRGSRGDERTRILRMLAVAHLYEAEAAPDGRTARKHYREASKDAQTVAGRLHDPYEVDEMAFIPVWTAWRRESTNASTLASRFTKKHRNTRELNTLAWLLQGEVALSRKRFREAERAYRYVVSMMDTPLYSLALFRTAQCYQGLGRAMDAEQAYEELIQFGCAAEGRRISDDLLVNAAAARGVTLVETTKGQIFPARCAPKTEPET
jgi:tetratricopeptide (TPR) repeat protein